MLTQNHNSLLKTNYTRSSDQSTNPKSRLVQLIKCIVWENIGSTLSWPEMCIQYLISNTSVFNPTNLSVLQSPGNYILEWVIDNINLHCTDTCVVSGGFYIYWMKQGKSVSFDGVLYLYCLWILSFKTVIVNISIHVHIHA